MIDTVAKVELIAKLILGSILILIALYIAIIETLSYESQKIDTLATQEILKHLQYE